MRSSGARMSSALGRRVLAVVLTSTASFPAATAAQSWRTVTMSRVMTGEKNLDVEVTYGAGTFSMSPAAAGLLYRMQLRYDEDSFRPQADYEGSRLRLGVESVGNSVHLGKNRSDGSMDLQLARGVPMNLDLKFGAVRADLDLGGLSLTRLELNTGASESTVDISELNAMRMGRARFEIGAADFEARHLGNLNAGEIDVSAGVGSVTLGFDGNWQRDADVKLEMGLGSLELRFPEGLGVSLHKDSFLTSLDSEGLVKRGDRYYSLDWDKAKRKIDIDLNAAFGSVKVVWVR
jgi:hypothetical protein